MMTVNHSCTHRHRHCCVGEDCSESEYGFRTILTNSRSRRLFLLLYSMGIFPILAISPVVVIVASHIGKNPAVDKLWKSAASQRAKADVVEVITHIQLLLLFSSSSPPPSPVVDSSCYAKINLFTTVLGEARWGCGSTPCDTAHRAFSSTPVHRSGIKCYSGIWPLTFAMLYIDIKPRTYVKERKKERKGER
jgi:hypothetical protein